jgi:hypothetical protein
MVRYSCKNNGVYDAVTLSVAENGVKPTKRLCTTHSNTRNARQKIMHTLSCNRMNGVEMRWNAILTCIQVDFTSKYRSNYLLAGVHRLNRPSFLFVSTSAVVKLTLVASDQPA